MSEQSLDDLLNDVEETETVEEVAEAVTDDQSETVADEAEAEKSDKAEAEIDSTTESKKDDEPDSWTKAAALDERHKRQESDRKVAELQKQLTELQQGTKARPDVFEDQDGAFSHLRGELAAEIQATRLEISQEMMREKHENYDELESEFIQMAKDNPVLLSELNQSRNPARYAVETALKARQAHELKDVDKIRATIEAEMRKEIEEKIRAEQGEAAAKGAKKRDALMPSLAASQSKSGVDDSEDDSLEATLGI